MSPNQSHDTAALFVRLPIEHARRLDRAARVLSVRKKDLVAGLVQRHVDPESQEGLDALRVLTADATPRRVTIDLEQPGLTLGHHSFQPAGPLEVLSCAQAADLLGVAEDVLLALAEERRLPGRKLAGQWRFSRGALLHWLGTVEHDT
ncbi:MAG: hypothetical protein DLM64_13310 [Solirubrobacterales bacterium]|nr:MAG: hypothetical protein DLM64_13310 [Solirubrobacterales bacterium]